MLQAQESESSLFSLFIVNSYVYIICQYKPFGPKNIQFAALSRACHMTNYVLFFFCYFEAEIIRLIIILNQIASISESPL